MRKPKSPEDFKKEVEGIIFSTETYEIEDLHVMTDKLMEEMLIELGYEDGVNLIRETERWYA